MVIPQTIFSQVPSYVPSNGLVGYWPFSGNANDVSGNNLNGTVSGASLTTDRNGLANAAYLFNPNTASNITIQTQSITGTGLQNQFSISMWVKANRAANYIGESSLCPGSVSVPMANSNQNWAFVPGNSGSNLGVGFSIGTNGIMVAEHANNILVSRLSNSSTYSNFVHVVIIYDNSNSYLYVNGTLVRTRTMYCSSNLKMVPSLISLGTSLYSPNFSGVLDDLGVWNRALTSGEVQQLYTACLTPAPTGSASQTLCSGSTVANLTATGTNIKWYATSTGGTALASTTALVNGTTYYASQTVNGCESTTRLAVTVTLNNPTVSASATTVCSGQPTTLTATPGVSSTSNFSVGSIGPAGGYVFYDKGSVTNGWRYLEAAPSNIQNSSWGCGDVNISGATSLAIGSGLTNTNAIVTTCTTPSIAARRCLDHSVNGYDDWYLPSQNEFAQIYQNLIVNNLGNFNVGPIPSMGTLYWTSSQLTAASGSHCCLECGGNFYQYSKVYELYVRPVRQFASGTPFSSYLWSTGATTASISVNPSTTTQYWVDITTNGVTCRKFITITVNSTTPAPTGDTTQTLCIGSMFANLILTGTNIEWYATSTGGTPLSGVLEIGTTTYYASQTVNGCESSTRLAVTVVVQNTIVPTFTQVSAICSGAPLSPLPTTSTNGITGSWSPVLNNTTTTTYTFIPMVGQCAATTTMIITVNSLTPAPTGNASQTLCSGSTVANLTATGTNIKWYSISTGGTALASTTALVSGTTYYASQTVSGCESTIRLAVTVTINNPTVSATSTTVCSGQPTTLTVSAGTSTTSNFSVGSIGPSGGYVFYDKGSVTNGWRYLEASPIDNGSDSGTGCYCISIPNTSTTIGTGRTNTTNWVGAGCNGGFINTAITFNINGNTNWFIPSKDELNLMYSTLKLNNLGNFQNVQYWTSSPASYGSCGIDGGAWVQNFSNGSQYSDYRAGYQGAGNLRLVRQFATGTPFSSYLWSTGATTASINVNPTATTQYWVDVTTNGVTCRKFITITVNSTTPAPTGNASQTLCSGSTVANLTATGTNIKWYATSTGGTVLASTTALVNGTTYFASQTTNGCESTTRLAVTVYLNNPTVSASSTTVCGGANVTLTANSNLTSSQIQTNVNNLVNSGLWNLLVTYNGHYYLKYQSTMTWPQAKLLCEQNGGYMYCVNSQLENINVSIPIANSQAFGNFLLGLYQDTIDVNFSEPSGGWKWLDGSQLTYTNWGQNEPNNNGSGENFNIMDWNNNGAVWNDITDVVNGTVIMEYPGITTYLWSTGETSQTINPSPNQTTQYWVDVTTNGVTCRKFITISVSVTPPPSGSFNQTMTQGSTLSNLVITGQNIQWYSTPFGGTPLPLNTPLVNGTTYYASQTINGCESQDRFPVIVQVTLGNTEFDDILLVYSPNPVIDILNIKSSVNLNFVTVTNVIGQLVSNQPFNSTEVQVDMNNLPTGTYFVIVEADNRKQTFKVLKK